MRITLDDSLTHEGAIDLEVREGTPVRRVMADFPSGAVWCGTQRLAGTHVAGDFPLLAGALLSASPVPGHAEPTGPHLAVIAGPDAGTLLTVDGPLIIGSGQLGHPLRDPALDPAHATITPAAGGGFLLRDAGSVNGTLVWRRLNDVLVALGRRRTARLRVGDVIVAGQSVIEVRGEDVTGSDARGEVTSGKEPGTQRHGSLLGRALIGLAAARGTLTLHRRLDPTAAWGWDCTVSIDGENAAGCARAVILARGRRPPPPLPLEETWLEWLPPPLPGDGWISIEPASSACDEQPAVRLTATAKGTTIDESGNVMTVPPVTVHRDTADSLARHASRRSQATPVHEVRWADAVALARPRSEDESDASDGRLRLVAGVSLDPPHARWELALTDASPHVLIAGEAGSGKSTCLATLVSALAATQPPELVSILLLDPTGTGSLEPCVQIPHITRAITHASAQEAARAVSALVARMDDASSGDPLPRLTVVVADDLEAYGQGGGEVATALERLALNPDGRVSLLIATARPGAVLSPRLRAAMKTVIALRASSEANSEDAIGVADAAHIQRDSPGEALVRHGGQTTRVRVALPIADRLPEVVRCDRPVPDGAHAATVAIRFSGVSRRPEQ